MHHDCSPPIIHRDISGANILLDSDYEAHVSDFGTSKLLQLDSSDWTTIAGTYGYIAPGNLVLLYAYHLNFQIYLYITPGNNVAHFKRLVKGAFSWINIPR
ncbi:putative protein kinase RLK-Pelle-LRR-XI-1 family [Helianthus annuus]|nr:putative protein kinase RLK-Pelle-LRR-XI-1 family [Helianthus annuus]KAJ0447557.1 putative protein kinase RLK-Pelle-LRR-XI-1 family [Helianthus annuus]KAJ0632464.1 putative protein kinase RLK-Pelle-LRR-XI-1 family [Helianthus annuus]KAJ0826338.1 putative protein kinase RLK-Pelle-LRR-XI-1 family [Helianthus annuus]